MASRSQRLEHRNVSRESQITVPQRQKKRKKKKHKKSRAGKRHKAAAEDEDGGALDLDDPAMSDPMHKLQRAHPRHIVKLILKKLCEKPSFYRMLGSLGQALKANEVSLPLFFLSNEHRSLTKTLRGKLRYDVNDQRVLLLARLAVHRLLIREGTRLRSFVETAGT